MHKSILRLFHTDIFEYKALDCSMGIPRFDEQRESCRDFDEEKMLRVLRLGWFVQRITPMTSLKLCGGSRICKDKALVVVETTEQL